MAGHNKWSKVKRTKAVVDMKRSKLFSQYARLITVASKQSGGDLNHPALRAAIEKARGVSMPKENIERAIGRGCSGEGENFEHVTFEAFGPGGVALMITGVTDNRNRTAAEIKHILSAHGTSLGAPGTASWAFALNTGAWVPRTTMAIDVRAQAALDALIASLTSHDDVEQIATNARA